MTPTLFKKILREHLPLPGLVLLGLLLRLPSPNGRTHYLTPSEFVRDLAVLKDMCAGQTVLQGPASSISNSFHFGPIYYYLYYPLAWLSGFRPYALALTSILFSLAAIVLIFKVARAWFKNDRIAYLTAFLLTISILDISFAKYGSNPNTIPFFALLFFYQLEKFLRGGADVSDAILLGLSLAVTTQLHAIPLLSLPLVLITAWFLARPKPDRRHVLALFLTVFLLYAPFLYYQLTNDFSGVSGLVDAVVQEMPFTTFSERFVKLASFGLDLIVRYRDLFANSLVTGFVLLLLNIVTASFVWLAEKYLRRSPGSMTGRLTPSVRLTLSLWLTAPALILLAPVSYIEIMPNFYFIMFLPLGYLLGAWGLAKLWKRGLRFTAGVILMSYTLWQAVQIWQYHLEYPSLLTAWLK